MDSQNDFSERSYRGKLGIRYGYECGTACHNLLCQLIHILLVTTKIEQHEYVIFINVDDLLNTIVMVFGEHFNTASHLLQVAAKIHCQRLADTTATEDYMMFFSTDETGGFSDLIFRYVT